jgi:cytochrome P450 / NADPH-cytochrome P450 reductase
MAKKNLLHPIPHPPRTFVLGNLLSLTTTTPVQDMMKLAREYGPIYWLDMLGKPVIIVSDFALVDELCDEARFDKSVRGALRRLRSFAGDGLFTAYTQEPNWAKAHNILLPSFAQRAMQGYHPMMLDIAEQLVLKWDRLNADDEIDVTHDMTSLTLDTIGLCGFGYRFNSFYRESPHPFVGAMIGALGASMETRGLPLENVIKKDRARKLRADIRYMNEMVDRIVRERRKSDDDVHDKPDLLSHMLSGVDRKSGERLDDLNIRYQVITFLIAGHETTSGLLSFAVYYLLNNPEVLARACAEVDRVLGPDPAILPTYQQVNQLTYIEQVLKEALRLWPTAPVFALSPYKDETIGGQYQMRKNYQIVVLSPMLHRDRKIWGDQADVFNPDHFSREAERGRPANAYKPFGNGQRACIGRQFALQEATLVLGMVLHRFKLIDHTRYRLALKEALTVKPDGFRIKVRRRTDRARATAGRVATTVMTASRPEGPAPATESARAHRPAHGTPLLLLYGSNLGTAEEVARRLGEAGADRGFAVTVGTLDEYAGRLPTAGAVLITSASYNGTPPDNAGRFCDWLRDGGLASGALAGVRYAVFGCGNRDWAATFQAVPRFIDATLEAHGASRIAPRGEGDARDDFDAQLATWEQSTWGNVAAALGLELAPAEAAEASHLTVEVVAGPDAGAREDAHGARSMRVAVNRELHIKTGPFASERSTRHIELELPAGVSYRAGDHLGVAPRNPDALVARVAARFGLDRESHVLLRRAGGRAGFLPVGAPIALARLLGEYVELQDVASRRHLEAMVEHTECPWTRPRLAALAADEARYRDEVATRRKSVLDLLEEYPACQLPFNVYLQLLAPLRPRYYSISSSPLQDARRCSITVAVVAGEARSGRGRFEGVCSNHLLRHGEGRVVQAFVKDTRSAFRLPQDPATPIIMVGPGTGLAPFRGFLQERAVLSAQGRAVGPALLFSGCRHPEQDFIYEAELRAFAERGVVTLHPCFSRVPERPRVYVQDEILARQDAVWSLLERGAVAYVCGDAARMAPDVRRAFAAVHRAKTGGSEAQAEAWIDGLIGANRYLIDVWGSS